MKKPVKLTKEIVVLLTPRIADEWTAFAFYRDASNYLQGIGFMKAAKYFAAESTDELTHAKGLESYLVDWNVHPELPALEAQDNSFDGIMDVIEKAYEIEYRLYESYEKTTMDVFNKGDVCTFFFLQTYNDIQRKSVAEYSDMMNLCEGVDTESKLEMLLLEDKLFGQG
ncbi:MAG: ferritin-like domain-containing protein [Melioribacteraceae bacterium]